MLGYIYYNISWRWMLLPAVVWFVIVACGSGLIYSNYHVRALCSNKRAAGKKIAITFDDGPTPETNKILDVLQQKGIKATFFCIGSQIEKHPEILQRIASEGHTIGNHTYSHSTRFGFLSTAEIGGELQLTDKLIKDNSGLKTKLFRPPYGVSSPYVARALRSSGHTVIGWKIRSLDAIIKDEARILRRIKSRLAPGSIILLHDTSLKTVHVLEQLLVLLQQDNYEMVTVDSLLNIPAYEE
jgi:peptidoglycan/xylan/chitin deacetylase (PgdA/CDA1 family)